MLCKCCLHFFKFSNTPHVLNVSSSVNRCLIVVFRLNWKQWITMHQRWKCPHCWIKPHSHFDFNGHHYSPHKTPDNMCSFRNSSRWKTASPYGDEDFNGKNQRHALRQYYMRSIKISQERERRKKSGHFWSGGLKNETPEWPADLWEPPVRIVFRFWHFCFCRQGGFWWERVRQRGQSAARAKPGLWVSLSLSLWWFAVWSLQSGCLWRLDACNMPMVDYAAQALSKALLTSRLTVLHLENTCLSGKPLFTLGMPSTHHPLEVYAS